MAHPNVEVLRNSDEAMARGDLEAFFSSFTDDVVVHLGGKSKLAGDFKGKDQMQEMFGRFMEAVGEYSFENHAYLADDEHGVILQRGNATRGGQTLELQEIFVMHFRGGKISEMWYFPTNLEAFDAWVT